MKSKIKISLNFRLAAKGFQATELTQRILLQGSQFLHQSSTEYEIKPVLFYALGDAHKLKPAELFPPRSQSVCFRSVGDSSERPCTKSCMTAELSQEAFCIERPLRAFESFAHSHSEGTTSPSWKWALVAHAVLRSDVGTHYFVFHVNTTRHRKSSHFQVQCCTTFTLLAISNYTVCLWPASEHLRQIEQDLWVLYEEKGTC